MQHPLCSSLLGDYTARLEVCTLQVEQNIEIQKQLCFSNSEGLLQGQDKDGLSCIRQDFSTASECKAEAGRLLQTPFHRLVEHQESVVQDPSNYTPVGQICCPTGPFLHEVLEKMTVLGQMCGSEVSYSRCVF